MNAARFLHSVCAPNVEAFSRNPTSFQHAWNALVSLHHCVDYLAKDRGEKVETLRPQIENRYPPSSFLRDIGDAYKHFEITRRLRRNGLSARHSNIGAAAAFSDGSYFSDGTSFTDAPSVLTSNFGGELHDLPELARNCLDYFANELRTE